MDLTKRTSRIEYACTYCGMKTVRPANTGRPEPGRCTRKAKLKDGTMRPHTWIINRKLG